MKRQEKFKNTATFTFYNANPKNRITGDCVVRAIATATEIPYNDVVQGMTEIYIKTGYVWNDSKGIAKYMEAIGWTKHKQPKKPDGTKYTGAEFCRRIQKGAENLGAVVANIGGHHTVAIIDGVIFDTWDSTRGCIGNYWVKG